MGYDKVLYLANIMTVVRADGKLTQTELGMLEDIRKEIKAKKSEYNSAEKLIEAQNYELSSVGSFADNTKNLEHILRAALSDNDLKPEETILITDFIKKIGIYEDQKERIYNEVIEQMKTAEIKCPSCGKTAGPDAKFCPSCGASLTEISEQTIKVALDIPSVGFAIEFADSTSADFPRALELAKSNTEYQTCINNKKTWHLAVFAKESFSEAFELSEKLGGMRNRRIYLDGEEHQWNDIFGFSWCASRRKTAYSPEEYCFGKDENQINPWGCKLSEMNWTEWAGWFSYGKWKKSGLMGKKAVWIFDKDRIRHEINTNLHSVRFCPHIRIDLIEPVIQHLPDEVCPETDPNWKYKREYEQVPGAIKIKLKEKVGGYIDEEEFYAVGVQPHGLKVLYSILRKAFAECKIDDEIYKKLL